MRAILDTSVLIGGGYEELEGDLGISSASLGELHFGVLVAKNATTQARRLRRLALIEATFDPIPVDAAVARSYGQLAATVSAAGRTPRSRVMDLLIAATAHAHGARLYTRNSEDLSGLELLVDISPLA